MIHTVHPHDTGADLSAAIARHSADRLLPYRQAHGIKRLLACYFPPDMTPEARYPALILIHGGGWSSRAVLPGQTTWSGDHLGFLARYFADRGVVAVSVDYGLVDPVAHLPGSALADAVRDCCDAVSTVRDHAAQLHIDLDRLFLLGESAGGHLAAAVDACSVRFRFRQVILVNPITDLTMDDWGTIALGIGSGDYRTLSPTLRAGRHCSPTLLLHGTADDTVDPLHSRLYLQALTACGVPAELVLLEGATHAFLLAEYYSGGLAACKTAIEMIEQAIAAP